MVIKTTYLALDIDEQVYDEACVRATEEGEASGLAEGDIFDAIRAKYGWKTRFLD
jgi:hypothetical protein